MRSSPLGLPHLERFYDGPIPEPLRRAAIAGSARLAEIAAATGEARFFAGLVRRQIEAIRRRRAAGGSDVLMLRDLALYRRERRRFRQMGRAGAVGRFARNRVAVGAASP